MIYYGSDLHLDIEVNRNFIKKVLKKQNIEQNSILLLCGDTFVLNSYNIKDNIFDLLSEKFSEVYLLFGNHEYYGGYPFQLGNVINYHKKIRKNIQIVNNVNFSFENKNIILSTLWTKINEIDFYSIKNRLNDFIQIKISNKTLNITDVNNAFETSFNFIKDSLKENTLIGTHHVPTYKLIDLRHKGEILNQCFYVELHNFIYDNAIDFWISGHSHYNENRDINGTRMLSNQLGYPNEMLNYKKYQFLNII